MEEEQTEVTEVAYEIVTEPHVDRSFAYEIEVDEDGFVFDDEENLMGALTRFESYPKHETLTSIFEDLLVKAVMQTQQVDEDEALELVQDFEDEDDYPDLSVSDTFSILFTVEGYSGLYRMLFDSGDFWVADSSGLKGDRWEI